jgi:hypothetical protein
MIFNKWIVIFQEFDLDFALAKSKNSLVFVELMSDFPREDKDELFEDSFSDESIFLISSNNPWYGDILTYLHDFEFLLALFEIVGAMIHSPSGKKLSHHQ